MAHPSDDPPISGTPTENRRWWAALGREQRADHLTTRPETIGALDGLPAEVRDRANRSALDRYIAATGDTTATWLRDTVGPDTAPPTSRAYLLQFRPPSTVEGTDALAAVSVGDPDLATVAMVYVPGATNNVGNFDYSVDFARQFKSELDVYSGGRAANAAVVWLGYDAPDTAIPGALRRTAALEGGPKLNDFLDGLAVASTVAPEERVTTAYGHSYGSRVIGDAASADRDFNATRIVVAASPGMGRQVRSVHDLNIDPDQMFATATPDDVVTYSPRAIHGVDPTTKPFGARVFAAEEGGHEAYFPPGTDGMRNLRNIVSGRLDRVREIEPRARSGLREIVRRPELRSEVGQRLSEALGRPQQPTPTRPAGRDGPPSGRRTPRL